MPARLAAASADVAFSPLLALMAFALVISTTSQALAQDSGSDNWRFKPGVGAGLTSDYEGSEDHDKDFALNLGAGYEISQRWDPSLLTQYKLMLGDAEGSPVVDDQGEEHQSFGGFVVSYTWGK